MTDTSRPASDNAGWTSLIRYDTSGARYVPETHPRHPGLIATYLTAAQVDLLLGYEMAKVAGGTPEGPTWALALAHLIHRNGPPPALDAAGMVSDRPDGQVMVPLCPDPGRQHVPLNGAEAHALARAYMTEAPGKPPAVEWTMIEKARTLADLAAHLDPQQFGHMRGAVSPRVEGQA